MNKEKLWNLLEKYDTNPNLSDFCNSISRIIQGVETDNDLVNLIIFNDINERDMDILNESLNIKTLIF